MLKILTLAAIAAIGTAGIAQAQQQQLPAMTTQAPTIKRTPLQKFDVPGTSYETVIGIAEVVPNVLIGRHTHPGPESGYVLDGDMTLLVDGQPPLVLKAGQSHKIPPGAVHDAKTGPKGAKVIATYVVEKGKPLASPAK
jgi:quercetin dioxygenase-like cupin family protein